MKNYLLSKSLTVILKQYILILLIGIIFLFISFTKSLGEENVFTINHVKVKGAINVNFSRENILTRLLQILLKYL